MHIPVNKTPKSSLPEVDFSKLGFGEYFSDHMFVAEYKNGEWHSARVEPYGEMKLLPSILSLHYGQSVFEGMKAFYRDDGKISVFRLQRHHARLNRSLHRMCMPTIPEELFVAGLTTLLKTDREWVPKAQGNSLYIRPFVFASEARLGLKISSEYRFVILTTPVTAYFSNPLRLKVEEEYVRAAEGGTGYVKCAGNYGGVFYPTQLARKQGFDQVIWTDAKNHTHIDESGAMNIMFVIQDKLITPALSSTILDGVTRDSVLTLSSALGIQKEERVISVQEIKEACINNTIQEGFAVGTAVVVAPISSIHIQGTDYSLPASQPSDFHQRAAHKINAIRTGSEPDEWKWNYIIN